MQPANYLSSLFSLTGRCAVVTGGSSGIGLAIAGALAGAGARVALVARDEQRLEQAREALVADGHDIVTIAADVGTDAGIDAVVDGTRTAFDGDPDVLVNSAGVNLRPPMHEVDAATWEITMAVNLRAPEVLSRRFAPGMIARGYGRLIHISSQQAHRAFATSGVYGVSKGGLESLSRSQAEAWSAHGVTSNTLVPGFVMTPLNARLSSDPDTVAALAARTMVGRNGLAEDFAAAAVFLAGPGSAYVTGSSLFVDGGLSAH